MHRQRGELLAAVDEEAVVGVAAVLQLPPHQLVEAVDDQHEAGVAGLDGGCLGATEEVVHRDQQRGAVLFHGVPQQGPGGGAVAQVHHQLAEARVELGLLELHLCAQHAADVVPRSLEVGGGRGEAGQLHIGQLLLELGGDEDQQVGEVEVVHIQLVADVAIHHHEARPAVAALLEQGLEAEQLAGLADAPVAGEELDVGPVGPGPADVAGEAVDHVVLAAHRVEIHPARVVRVQGF